MDLFSQEPEVIIANLSAELIQASELYYKKGVSPLSDFEFDQKLKELEALENQFPQFKKKHSPTLHVGSDLSDDFAKVNHNIPMLSISNTYNEQEVADFHRQVSERVGLDSLQYVVEMKIDGVSLALHYKQGHLHQAITRGDGSTGDDVSRNLKLIQDIPQYLKAAPPELEIRGEVYMRHDDFAALNTRSATIGKTYQNPRNTAAGSLKLKDSKTEASRVLRFFAYSAPGAKHFKSHSESLQWLSQSGFKTSPWYLAHNPQEIMELCQGINQQRNELEFDIDGAVIKVDDLQQQQRLGATSKSPRWVVAYKFKAEQVESQIISVDYQIGRTGAVTPVANLTPVRLGGTTVKRATLHNFAEVQRLDLHLLDHVMIEKGGEIIPKVVSVITERRTPEASPIHEPTECPECNFTLVKIENEVALRCENPRCPAQKQRFMEHFVSREAMNIENLGPALIEQLIAAGMLNDLSDLYNLDRLQLLALDRMAAKSVDNVLQSIEKSKTQTLDRFIHGLGIRHVGRNAAKALCKMYSDIDSLMNASEEDLEKVPEIGYKTAKAIAEWFSDIQNRELIEKLTESGLNLKQLDLAQAGPFKAKIVVITGTLATLDREAARALIEQAGGKVASSVSKKTDFVLAGDSSGQKLERAQELGIKILSEDSFLEMLES
jgi:DNA ligase (NAD+)